jgi:hypothetical protein
VNGTPVTPSASVILTLPAATGPVQVQYTVPTWGAASPGQTCADPVIADDGTVADGCWAPNETNDFAVRVAVDPASFAAPGGAPNNNGGPALDTSTGWQPGDGMPFGVSTLDETRGSLAGQPYPNNDWSAARVTRSYTPPPPPGSDLPIVFKSIWAPTQSGVPVWDPLNKFAKANPVLADRTNLSAASKSPGIAPDTELTSRLTVTTGAQPTDIDGNPEAYSQLVFGDTWDNREQSIDPNRALTWSASVDAVGTGTPQVWWSPDPKTPDQLTDLNDTAGWTAGWPTASQAVSVRSRRIVVAATAPGASRCRQRRRRPTR